MTKIRWKKKLDTLKGLFTLGLILAFTSSAVARMEITYKRSGAPLAERPKDSTPVKITYIKTGTKKTWKKKATQASRKLVTVKKIAAKPSTRKKSKAKSQAQYANYVAANTPASAYASQQQDDEIQFDSTDAQSTMAFAPEAKKAPKKAWGASTSLTYTRSMVDQQDGSMSSSVDMALGASYKFEPLRLSANLSGSRDMQEEESQITDFSVSMSLNPIKAFDERLNITPSGSFAPAVSKNDKYASLQAKTRVGLRMSLNSDKLGLGNFGISGSVDFRKNFHEYTTARSGAVNTEYGSMQSIGASYDFSEKLSAAVNVMHSNTWSYNGIQSEFFSHSQEVSYAITKSISVSGGHQMGFVSAWKDSGTERNFDLIDDDNSFIFASLSVSY